MRGWRVVKLGVAVLMVLTGCGNQADCEPAALPSAPEGIAAPDAQTPVPATSAGSKKPVYSWGLPAGDASALVEANSLIYVKLDKGQCQQAQVELDRSLAEFNWPGEVVLYQAAIYLCRNDTAAATATFGMVESNKARYPHGWAGVGWVAGGLSWHICEIYKATAGVIRQRSGDSISCEFRLVGNDPSPDEAEWLSHPGSFDPRKK